MLAKVFLALCQIPVFRRLVWKPIYNYLAKMELRDWSFMNYGYEPLDGRPKLQLLPKDEEERYAAQLYHYLAINTEIKDKDVLEVGSGRGGGASHIKRYLHPKTMVGMDLAQNAVDLSNKKHQVDGLKYIQGNAEKLPFEANSFDVIINVESCHAYGSMTNFLSEVHRVLRPNGIFLCTDMRLKHKISIWEEELNASGLKMLDIKTINDNVVKAIELDHDRKMKRIESDEFSEKIKKAFGEFAGIRGSKIHLDFASGERIYKWYKMQK